MGAALGSPKQPSSYRTPGQSLHCWASAGCTHLGSQGKGVPDLCMVRTDALNTVTPCPGTPVTEELGHAPHPGRCPRGVLVRAC